MERRLYKELWRTRFEKMLKLEKQSIVDYSALIKECDEKYKIKMKKHPIQEHLEEMIEDEGKHARLVEELLKILGRQPD